MISKTTFYGKVKITVHRPDEPDKMILEMLYDHLNMMAYKARERGIDTSDMFYTPKEVEELKKDKSNKFI